MRCALCTQDLLYILLQYSSLSFQYNYAKHDAGSSRCFVPAIPLARDFVPGEVDAQNKPTVPSLDRLLNKETCATGH